MTLPPKSYAHKLYTFCEQPVKIMVNLHNPTVNSTEPVSTEVVKGWVLYEAAQFCVVLKLQGSVLLELATWYGCSSSPLRFITKCL